MVAYKSVGCMADREETLRPAGDALMPGPDGPPQAVIEVAVRVGDFDDATSPAAGGTSARRNQGQSGNLPGSGAQAESLDRPLLPAPRQMLRDDRRQPAG